MQAAQYRRDTVKRSFLLGAMLALLAGTAAASHPPEEFVVPAPDGNQPDSPKEVEETTSGPAFEEVREVVEESTEVYEPPAELESETELDWGVETEIEEIAAEKPQ